MFSAACAVHSNCGRPPTALFLRHNGASVHTVYGLRGQHKHIGTLSSELNPVDWIPRRSPHRHTVCVTLPETFSTYVDDNFANIIPHQKLTSAHMYDSGLL